MNIAKAVGVSALILSLCACGNGQSPENHIAKANQFIASSDYRSAVIELKNALQLDAKSAEARYLLGVTHIKFGDMPSAQKELQRALSLGWPSHDVGPALAQTLLAQGEYQEVLDISDQGLATESLAKLLATQAQATLALGNRRGAEDLIDTALDMAPDSPEVLLAEARMLAGQGSVEEADTVLEKVLSIDAKQGKAWSMRGDILSTQREFASAVAAYDNAIPLQLVKYEDLFKRAMLNLQLGNFDAAQNDADKLLAAAPKSPGANYLQGLLHYQAARYAQAVATLSVTEPAFLKFPLALYFLASAQLMEGSTDQAANLAERFYKLLPDNIQGRKLLAAIRLQQGEYQQVEVLLRPVLEAHPDDLEALNLAANALLRNGKTEKGIELLSRVASLQPDSSFAQLRLGAGLLAGGRNEAAARHMEAALELNPEFQQADILLVLNLLRQGDFESAIAAAEAYQRRNMDSITPHNLLAKVYLEAGQPDKAGAAFKTALELHPADPAANHGLAQLALMENDMVAARKYYETALAEHEDSVATLIQLAMLGAREGDEAALVIHLERAMAVDPNAVQPRVMLARFYLGTGKPERVAALFTNLNPQQQQLPEVLRLTAVAHLSSKAPDAAQFTLEQLLAATPDSAPIRHMMAMAAAGSGNDKRAREELARAIVLNDSYVPSRIALARILLLEGASPPFQEQLQRLMELAPENPDVLILQAAAATHRGELEVARSLVEEAFRVAPSGTTLIAAATNQEASGDREGALKRYLVWLNENPRDTVVRMAYANSLQVAGRLEDAGDQYAAVLKITPNNVIALNNRAWILREESPAQALELARRASTLAPDSVEVLDTLAIVEYHNKEYSRAQRSIARALKAAPDQPSMLYHSAMIAVALDKKAEARDTLKQLLAQHAEFPEIADARALQARLGE